jgi:hypothetical protein
VENVRNSFKKLNYETNPTKNKKDIVGWKSKGSGSGFYDKKDKIPSQTATLKKKAGPTSLAASDKNFMTSPNLAQKAKPSMYSLDRMKQTHPQTYSSLKNDKYSSSKLGSTDNN